MNLTASVESLLATLREYEGACPCANLDGHRLDCRIGCFGVVGKVCYCSTPVDHMGIPKCAHPLHSIRRRALEGLSGIIKVIQSADDFDEPIDAECVAALAAIDKERAK